MKLTPELTFTATATASLNISLALAAFVGNASVIVAYNNNKAIQTNANFLLVCLAVTDFLVGALVQPLLAAQEILLLANDINCVVLVTFTTSRVFCATLSVMTVLIISCERYLALFWPLRYRQYVTKRRIVFTIAMAWLTWTLVVATRFVGLPNKVFRLTCSVVIVCSHVVTGLVYLRIQRLAKRHVKEIKRHGQRACDIKQQGNTIKQHKALKTTLYVTACLFICYTPLVCVLIAVIAKTFTPELVHQLFAWADTLVFLNSSVNPCIYCWRNAGFRTTILACFQTPRETRDVARDVDTCAETKSGMNVQSMWPISNGLLVPRISSTATLESCMINPQLIVRAGTTSDDLVSFQRFIANKMFQD